MRIKCKRPIITLDGTTDLEFIFDTVTLELVFDSEDANLLLEIFNKKCLEFPELTTYEIME